MSSARSQNLLYETNHSHQLERQLLFDKRYG
ncbi:hypothetical protein BKP42_61600 [Rhodococcus erythropolis]|nr:hypothetical protein BKP42_61600 [Rhodococcus erythropolis]